MRTSGVEDEIFVRRDGEFLKITWTCGAAVRFSLSDLDAAVTYIEMFKGPTWTKLDADGTEFYAQLNSESQELYINDHVPEYGGDTGDSDSVNWPIFRRLLSDMVNAE